MRFLLAILLLLPHWLLSEEIPAGTRLLLRAEQSLTSKTAKAGDRVRLRTVFPAAEGERVVVPAGALVEAEVATVQRSKWVGGHARLTLHATRIILPDGRVYPLTALEFDTLPANAMRPPPRRPYLALAGVFAGLYTVGAVAVGTTKDRAVISVLDAALVVAVFGGRGTEIEIREGMELFAVLEQAVPLD